MKLDSALRRYREDRFIDDDITCCAGLTERSWRELIKLGPFERSRNDAVLGAFANAMPRRSNARRPLVR
jgi:hypothetical protein